MEDNKDNTSGRTFEMMNTRNSRIQEKKTTDVEIFKI